MRSAPIAAIVLLVTLLSGWNCMRLPNDDDRAPPPNVPNIPTIITVVKHAYRMEGHGRIVFLAAPDVDGSMLTAACGALENDLGVKVRPEEHADRTDPDLPALTPVLPETGEIGISIRLGRFNLAEDGRLHVTVSFARSGLDGGDLDYVLERAGDEWSITDVVPGAVA